MKQSQPQDFPSESIIIFFNSQGWGGKKPLNWYNNKWLLNVLAYGTGKS